jgi:hypothetical protein
MFRAPIAALGLAALAGGVEAAPAVGLIGDRTLAFFDTADAKVTRTLDVTEVDALLGIDWRPSTGRVYGVTRDGRIVAIDLTTGAAVPVAQIDKMLPLSAAPVVVDFNPAADKLRFMSGTSNFRVDVESGKVVVDGDLAFAAGDMHKGEAPMIAAAAYTNSFGKPESTRLFNIDATIVALIQQVKPNDGTLAAIGKLGIPGAASYAFDVQTTAAGENVAWLVAGGTLYRVSLETGKTEGAWPIEGAPGAIRDLAVLPAN